MKGRAFAAVLAVVGLLTGVLASVADPASAVAGSAGGSTLYAGQRLTDYSEALVSPNGEFNLLLDRGDPTLLELDRFYRSSAYTGGDSWEALGSLTPGLGVGSLRMQMDGNLVLYAASTGRALWSTRTAGSGAGNRLTVQDDGNLVLYSDGGRALWQSNTRAVLLTGGQSLAAGQALLARPKPGSWIEFAMQTDGNLV
ncbi:MAG: hypothetical protein J0H43_07935, partial [Actinobacteria bacterium]|nr:hypothetical protein [Actinomycetota bacterium]